MILGLAFVGQAQASWLSWLLPEFQVQTTPPPTPHLPRCPFSNGRDVQPDPVRCPADYYFKCNGRAMNAFPVRCPTGLFFDHLTNRCTPREQVHCPSRCCDGCPCEGPVLVSLINKPNKKPWLYCFFWPSSCWASRLPIKATLALWNFLCVLWLFFHFYFFLCTVWLFFFCNISWRHNS